MIRPVESIVVVAVTPKNATPADSPVVDALPLNIISEDVADDPTIG